MTFDEFLKEVMKKLAPQAAFDLSRDVRLEALQKLLIEKKVATKEEIDKMTGECFNDMAKKIKNMQPPPNPQMMNPNAKKHD